MPTPTRNSLLAALPDSVQRRLFPHLEYVSLPLDTILQESGMEARYVYFPTDSLVSLIHVMKDGHTAGVSVVGNDGIVGVSVFMGGESEPSRAVVQSAGGAYRMSGYHLREEFDRGDSGLRMLLLRYTQVLITQMAQTAVCNRHHSIDQQLCRWLLLALDRLGTNQLNMTHELISNILGVRREGVTDAAKKLRNLGAIDYCRGKIMVLDREKLEEMSCECYATVKKEESRLMVGVAA